MLFAANRLVRIWQRVLLSIAVFSAFQLPVQAVNHPWAGKQIASSCPARRQVDIPTIYSILAQQENNLIDVSCEFRVLSKDRASGKLRMRTTGVWKASFPNNCRSLRIDRTSEDFKKVETDLFTYNGKETRTWASTNNSGGFSKRADNSSTASFPWAPSVFFRTPLPQEAPILTYSDILNPDGIPELGKTFFQPEIVGWEKIRLAEGECETVVIDVVMKASWRVKLWLDPEKDYLPRRTLHYAYRKGKSEPDQMVDTLVDEYETLKDANGRPSYVVSRGRVSGSEYGIVNEYETISISVNKGLTEADFDFEWPEGCLLVNDDNNDWGYMRGGRYVPGRLYEEAKDMAESIELLKLTSPTLQPKTAPDPSPPVSAEKPGLAQESKARLGESAPQAAVARTIPTRFWITGGCAVLAVGFLVFLYRRGKTR